MPHFESCDFSCVKQLNSLVAIKIYKKKQQKLSYTYSKYGRFEAKFSGNISSVCFVQNNSSFAGFKQQLLEVKCLSSSMQVLEASAFYDCYNLTAADLHQGLKMIGDQAFSGCQRLQELEIPATVQTIGASVFSDSRNLKQLTFQHYEAEASESASFSQYELKSLGSRAMANNQVSEFILPPSITSFASLDDEVFSGAKVSSLTFLGIDSTALLALQPKIAATKLLGLDRYCEVIASDGKKIIYESSGKSFIEELTYSVYGSAKIKSGKVNKMKLGKTFYWFTEELHQWCIDPTKQDKTKFPNPKQCPLIIFYGDFLTSTQTKSFLHDVLENSEFFRWAKEELKCFLFIQDRAGAVNLDSGTPELKYLRSILHESASQDFVLAMFQYQDKKYTATYSGSTLNDLKTFIADGSKKCGFSSFDYSQYANTLDTIDPETIPTNAPNSTHLRSFAGELPWWWNGSAAAAGQSLDLSELSPINFQTVSTPETTYILVGAYDMKYPSQFPAQIRTALAPIWKSYSDNVRETYNAACVTGEFKRLFSEGYKWRHFICYEFSHGSYHHITVGITYKYIWEIVHKCRGKVFLMFDSCDSGSMFEARSKLLSGQQDQQVSSLSSQATSEDLGGWLVKKFQRRSQLMKSLFNASTADIDPQVICWSSTTAHTYGWYDPPSSTLFERAIVRANKESAGSRYLPTFKLVKQYGTKKFSEGDCVPQRRSYQNGQASGQTDNYITIDAENCIIWM